MDAYELISTVADWSRRDDRVVAAAVCGSYARGDARPDSDVDLCIVTPQPGLLLDDRSWIHSFGASARIAGPVEDYNLVQAIRVFYGPTEAEFAVTEEAWMQLPIDRETAGVINDGLKILYDPDGCLSDALIYVARTFD